MTTYFKNAKVITVTEIQHRKIERGGNGVAKENAKLRGRIVEKYGSQARFAEAIGKTIQTVNMKLCGNTGFSQDDIVEWANALDISVDAVGEYFFAHLLSKS